MAEAVMRHQVEQAGLSGAIEVDSAGTGDWHIGHSPHEGTRKLLDERKISYRGMKARQVTVRDFSDFEYIICMDTNNLRDVRKLLKNAARNAEEEQAAEQKLFTFMELIPDKGIQDVPDPYYDGNFSYVYELVEEGCKELLRRVQAELKR
jgi:protein-tyrosine phosphatase